MADINLLQNVNVPNGRAQRAFHMLSYVGNTVLFFSIAMFVLFFALTFITNSKLEKVSASKAEIENKIKKQDNYTPLIMSQQRAKNLSLLLDQHLNWSDVLPKFSAVTLNTAAYNKFQANQDGSALITGTVPDFQALSKMMQAFQSDQQLKYIKDVKLVNVALGSADNTDITFSVKVTFDKEFLKTKKTKPNTN
jgi:hypothetical protein